MGWGYRKRVRLFPGVWMNVSKRGIGFSAGVKGARVSTGPNGTWLSTSFMGFFSREKLGSPRRIAAGQGRTQGVGCLGLLVVAAGALGVFLCAGILGKNGVPTTTGREQMSNVQQAPKPEKPVSSPVTTTSQPQSTDARAQASAPTRQPAHEEVALVQDSPKAEKSAVPTTIFLGREWTDSAGRHHVEAEFHGVDGDTVMLKKPDGTVARVPLERLSELDRQFATKLQSVSTIELASGSSLECTTLQSDSDNLTVLYGTSVLRIARPRITSVHDVIGSKPPPPTSRLPDYRTVIVTTAVQTWASGLQQIPATVIDNGVLRNVPYKSFRAGRDYEVNVYGDPSAPAGFEIGIHRGPLDDDSAKPGCVEFVCSLLGDPADRQVVRGLSLQKDKKERNQLTFEITPATDPDAYGAWWASAYSEALLNSARASDKEMESITVNRTSPAAVAPSSNQLDKWSSQDMQYARTPAKGHGAGNVYVRGYTRKDGTYVQPHTRSSPRH